MPLRARIAKRRQGICLRPEESSGGSQPANIGTPERQNKETARELNGGTTWVDGSIPGPCRPAAKGRRQHTHSRLSACECCTERWQYRVEGFRKEFWVFARLLPCQGGCRTGAAGSRIETVLQDWKQITCGEGCDGKVESGDWLKTLHLDTVDAAHRDP